MTDTYRVGLAGCGRMGATIDDEVIARNNKNQLRWLPYSHAAAVTACQRTDLVAIADPIADKAEAIRDRYGAGRAYTDFEEMIDREKLDILCIATRPGPHGEITMSAAESGVRGIYCEKPLCNSMLEADAMSDACERHGVKFNYGTQRRYKPVYRQAAKMVADGAVGEVQAVMAYCGAASAQWGHTHTADMILMLAGDTEAEFVQGTIETAAEDWDGNRLAVDPLITMGYIRFRNGVHGNLLAAGGFEYEVGGSEGVLRVISDGIRLQLRKPDENGALIEVPTEDPEIYSPTLGGIEDLVRALDDDGETQGNLRLACRSQELILGFVESGRLGGARVELPLENRDLAIAPANF